VKNRDDLPSKITIAALALFLAGIAALNMMLEYQRPADYALGVEYARARVIAIESDTIAPDPAYDGIRIGRQDLVLEITSGKHRGEIIRTYNLVERIINNPAQIGTAFIISSYDDFITCVVTDYDRRPVTFALAALFAAGVALLGGKKGIKSLAALVFTLMCIVFLFIPLIISGVNPIAAALPVVAASTVVTLWLPHGWSAKTVTAVISCAVCTLLAGLISALFGALANITTMNTPEAESLLFIAQGTNLSFRHLLFAGILFSSLGAITDTSMSISSAVFEMRALNPQIERARLMRSGMNIGRDIMGTMTDTLILAFAGSSVNTIVTLYMYGIPYLRLINMQLLVVEVLRGLSSTTAVVASIPVTTLIAVFFARGREADGNDGRGNARASL
jgi:uncharacterized membrane protein